jgi:hypothetical protein
VSHPNYNPDTIIIKRKLRPGLFTLDLLGAMSIYLAPSMIIDYANGNIWKVKKSSKLLNLSFDYNDNYYREKFELAKKGNDVTSINNYITTFTKSPFINEAKTYRNELIERDNYRDSVLSKRKYRLVESFLEKYPKSIYQVEMQNLAIDLFFKEQGINAFQWDNIGKYVQSVYNFKIQKAKEFTEAKKYKNAIENYQYCLRIFNDTIVQKKLSDAFKLERTNLIEIADKYFQNKDFEKAIDNYSEAQKIQFTDDIRTKYVEAKNEYTKVLEERERKRKIEIENSAIKCIECKTKIYQNEKGYYPTYWWSPPNLGGLGCMFKPVNEKPSSVGGMGPYCSSSCCDKDHPKKKY